jgi:hypothetical protein
MRRKERNKTSKVIPGVMISLCALIIIYFGMTMYFKNNFYFGSVINGIDVTGKTVEEAEKELAAEINTYTLELEERGEVNEQIKATDIGMKYDENKINDLKEKQNSISWVLALFKKNDTEMSQIVTYDEELLKENFDKLSCLDSSNIIKPQDASLEYAEDGYKIVDEVKGNSINKDIFYDSVVDAIIKSKVNLNLDASNCYENPKFTSTSQEVIDAKNLLDKYAGIEITYNSGDKKEIIDGDIIHTWLEVDKDMKVLINEEKVRNSTYRISSVFNTFGNTRNFVTTDKNIIQVSGGNYGWIVNNAKEAKDLIENIKNGQDIIKEPAYAQTAKVKGSSDVGNTYVEINMTKQHLWFYKNGSLVVEGDVVTGNQSTNNLTPAGTYILNYKERNATLKGEDYSSPVEYWLPFNGNIGIHDASWRSEFGKEIYMTDGSHGCINSPYELAKTIYENIEEATPIVCYYE